MINKIIHTIASMRLKRLATGLFFVLCLFIGNLHAQQQTQTSSSENGEAKPKGKITLSISEAEAEVKILNRYNMVEVKKTQMKKIEEYRLNEGMYRVEVSKKNHLSVVRDVYVSIGSSHELTFELQPFRQEKKGIFGAAYTGMPQKESNKKAKYYVLVGVAAVVLGATAILLGSGSETASTLPTPPGKPGN